DRQVPGGTPSTRAAPPRHAAGMPARGSRKDMANSRLESRIPVARVRRAGASRAVAPATSGLRKAAMVGFADPARLTLRARYLTLHAIGHWGVDVGSMGAQRCPGRFGPADP